MNNLKLAVRNVFSGKRGQLGKIVFLGAGLAAGLMLLTKVWFEQSFEGFYPDVDRVYTVRYNYVEVADGEDRVLFSSPGGVGPYLKERLPEVEAATRFTPLSFETAPEVFFTGSRQKLAGKFILADSCFYDVLPRPMIAGNAKEILSRPMYVMISRSLAEAIDGDPVGQRIELNNHPGKTMTIGGVFEDVPENTLYRYDVVVSLTSIGQFMWDGSNNMNGNERYRTFVKLYPGTDLDRFNDAVQGQIEKLPMYETFLEWGTLWKAFATPVTDMHKEDPQTRRMSLVLLILAASILFATVFNYLLVVLSDTMARGREIAVMKCHGAGFREIASRVLAETFLQLAVLTVVAAALVVLFRGTAEQVLSTSVAGLITWKSGLLLGGVMVLILAVSTYVQARIYNNIPVATVFRNYKGTGRRVKLALLFVQIAAATFLAVLLVTVIRQYNAMVNDDPGYNYENLLVTSLYGVDTARKNSVAWEINSLPDVESISLGTTLPFEDKGGNNVILPGTDQDLFNIADMYYADENYVPILGMKVTDGENFSRGRSRPGDIMVSRSFVETLANFTDLSGGVIGMDIWVSEHEPPCVITGVYEDIKIGTIGSEDLRPTVLSYSEDYPYLLLVKMKQLGYEPIASVNRVLESLLPERDTVVSVYADLVVKEYQSHLLFRKSITIASIIVMIIVLVGLVGYVRDETARRQKEIAIRKINGATVGEILAIMSGDIVKIMAPAMVLGIAVAYWVGGRWMEEFSVKAPMHWWIAAACALLLAIAAVTAVTLSALQVARRNPAESIKIE